MPVNSVSYLTSAFNGHRLTHTSHDDHLSTRVIHVASEPAPGSGAVISPISLSTTFAQSSIGVHGGFEYTRSANPNRNDLEAVVASLEGAQGPTVECLGTAPVAKAVAFSCGSAATATVVNAVAGPNGHIICMSDVYGGTYRYLTRVAKELGMSTTFVDLSSANSSSSSSSSSPQSDQDVVVVSRLLNAWTPQTRLIWIETPTNPTLRLVNIPLISQTSHTRDANVKVCVDNTFLTPYFQKPLDLGADIVVHSATKYLNGHSDVLLGVAISNDAATLTRLRFLQNAHGAVPGAFDSWLTQRGLKTLTVRMKRHGENAFQLASWLHDVGHLKRNWVNHVSYAGLSQSPTKELAWQMIPKETRQELEVAGYTCQTGFPYGGMISFRITTHRYHNNHSLAVDDDGVAAITRTNDQDTAQDVGNDVDVDDSRHAEMFLQSTRLFTLAESLGGVESLAELPSRMTHASVAKVDRIRLGIDGSLVRLSVGIEDIRDLIRDVEQALDKASRL